MKSPVQGAAAFSKNVAVLQLIADAQAPLSATDIAEAMDIPRPTAYRLIAALEVEGFIVSTPGKSWALGPRLLQLAAKSWEKNDLRSSARPYLEELCDLTGETVHLAIRNGDEMVYIDKVESRESVRMTSTIGARVPFHSTSVGRAYLLALPAGEREHLIQTIPYPCITANTVNNPAALEDQLSKFADKGFAAESEENESQVSCFGAPILNSKHYPAAAVSVSIPMFRMREDTSFYTAPLKEACQKISTVLPPF